MEMKSLLSIRTVLILSSFLFVLNSSAQFVDTLNLTVSRGYSVFGIANHNCRETHTDLGCKTDKNSTCFVCKVAQNETDSILMYKTRIHDSLYMKIHDKKGTLRLEYLQPHAHSIYGRVKVYNKKGELISHEYYSYGDFHEETTNNHHDVDGHKPFRAGLWKYYKKGELVKTERYQLLHTNDQKVYFVLVKELTYFKGTNAVDKHKEYVVHLDDLEFMHKPLKYKNPIFVVKGYKP